MKLILVNQRYGHTRTIVIRGWMKGLLSLCLLGAPVALGYLGYELALADNNPNALVSQEATVSSDEFISSPQRAMLPVYHSGLSEHSAGNTRAQDNFHQTLALAASMLVPLATLAPAFSAQYNTHTRAVFAHGRLLDPAVYSSRALH